MSSEWGIALYLLVGLLTFIAARHFHNKPGDPVTEEALAIILWPVGVVIGLIAAALWLLGQLAKLIPSRKR
jgi:hypothetical protein